MRAVPPGGDPGLQVERTALAWRRTVLATFAGAGLLAVSAQRAGHAPVVWLTAAAALTLAVAVAVFRRRTVGRRARTWPVLAFAAWTVVTLALLGLSNATASIVDRVIVGAP